MDCVIQGYLTLLMGCFVFLFKAFIAYVLISFRHLVGLPKPSATSHPDYPPPGSGVR
uniref:p6 n=1 Tax=Fig mild mottle-associated virus TaxID=666641 RepID=D3GBB1_9CLOS|nr:p6 [Fig mild mottle-associated virus]